MQTLSFTIYQHQELIANINHYLPLKDQQRRRQAGNSAAFCEV